MGNTITHFMWGYQQHFRIAMGLRAEDVFGKLDQRLQPSVFLAGVLDETSMASRFPTCVEPEDDFWIRSSELGEVRNLSQSIVIKYPESQLFHSHPLAQERETQRLQRRSIQDAIKQVIEAHPGRPLNRRFYVSYPAQVEEFLVCMVLSLDEDVVASYPELQRDAVPIHEYRSYPVPVSLLDAVVEQFLANVTEELSKPEPCYPESKDSEEFLRSAGDRMAQGVVWRMSEEPFMYGHDLFRNCTTISSLQYERSAGSGRILLASKNHSGIEHVVSFETPVKLRNFRAARKLLQLAFEDISLHCDSNEIYGIARVGTCDWSKEDQFEVQIIDHHHWELRHNGRILMTVNYGLPSLPKLGLDEEAFRKHAKNIFDGIEGSSIDLLLSLVTEAGQESHGTLLVISTNAGEEARRLTSQGTPIAPCLMTPELLRHLTPIDGAIMLDTTGICHAIGTILDGRATINGDPGRGARFNSAVRYVESFSEIGGCLAVVVSEDGDIDFVPRLGTIMERESPG